MILGIDVSSHQPVVNWAKVKAAGYEFAVIKITGGDRYVNPKWQQQYDGARAAGIAVGLYHYDGEPTVSTGSGLEEALFFLGHLPDPLPPDVFLAYDIEERATRDAQRYEDFLECVRVDTGKRPYLYTFKSFVEEVGADFWRGIADYPLWYAWYPNVIDPLPQPPPPPAPWTSYQAWQYSGGTTIPGIPNATDANAFYGTLDELTGIPAPPPAADPIVARTYINAQGQPVTEINWGGEMVEILGTDYVNIGMRGRNAQGAIYHRSIIDNEGKEYVQE